MRASRGISIHTGMAFLRNEFYNMSIYRVSFWEYPKVCVNLQTDVR